MTTTVTVKVPEDVSYVARVVMIDTNADGDPLRTISDDLQPGAERIFHAHSTRTIQVSEVPIPVPAVQAEPSAA